MLIAITCATAKVFFGIYRRPMRNFAKNKFHEAPSQVVTWNQYENRQIGIIWIPARSSNPEAKLANTLPKTRQAGGRQSCLRGSKARVVAYHGSHLTTDMEGLFTLPLLYPWKNAATYIQATSIPYVAVISSIWPFYNEVFTSHNADCARSQRSTYHIPFTSALSYILKTHGNIQNRRLWWPASSRWPNYTPWTGFG